MKRVRFLRDVIYETEGVGRGPTFLAGSEHELRDDLADRWLRREVAEVVVAAEPSTAVLPAAPKADSEEAPPAEEVMQPSPLERAVVSRRGRR